MININRPAAIPASLEVQEIKDYLDDLDKFHNKLIANKPDPPVSYRNSDILDVFNKNFYAKCYLTEEKYLDAHEMDIDHFESFNGANHKRYDWNNLFPASHKANMMRPRIYPNGGLLDPCNSSDDVENNIFYSLSFLGEDPAFTAIDLSNIKAVNTATELNIVHNGRINNQDSINNTRHLRLSIEKKFKMVMLAIIKYQNVVDDFNKFQTKRDLQDLLSRRSSFTMLIRSSVPVREARLPADFFD